MSLQPAGTVNAFNFNDLYTQYHDRLLLNVLKLVRNREQAEDIVSRTFQLAFEKRSTFRGEASFYSWLFAIARNEIHHLRSSRKTLTIDTCIADSVEQMHVCDEVLTQVERDTDHDHLKKALNQVPALFRAPLIAHFLKGQSVREIAHAADVPVGTILSRIFAGKRFLRQAWKEVG